jgi:dihydroxyacid dehydratase/phosphogluconate dehydratase
LKPSKILTRQSFLNAIAAIAALGGSTNAQPHLHAMARHAGVELKPRDWTEFGLDIPLLVNMQPAGKYLGERFHRAGGVPAVLCELLSAGCIDGNVATVTGLTLAENIVGHEATDREVIYPYDVPLQTRAGFLVLSGNLFDFAIMKTSVISEEFRARFLRTPGAENVFEARAVVFDGSDDYHTRINDPALDIDEHTILVIRGSGPLGWPGSAEVVNMQPPDALLKRGVTSLPTLGDGRQSGTSDSPSILNAAPESAAGGGLAWLRTGDVIRVDLNAGRCDALVEADEIARRKAEPPPPHRRQPHPLGRTVPRHGGPARHRRDHGDGGEIPRRGGEDPPPQPLKARLGRMRQRQKLLTRARIIPHVSEQGRSRQQGTRRINAAHGHAGVLGLDHHADALGRQHVLNGLGDLGGELFLNLQAVGEALHHARQFRNTHHAVGR